MDSDWDGPVRAHFRLWAEALGTLHGSKLPCSSATQLRAHRKVAELPLTKDLLPTCHIIVSGGSAEYAGTFTLLCSPSHARTHAQHNTHRRVSSRSLSLSPAAHQTSPDGCCMTQAMRVRERPAAAAMGVCALWGTKAAARAADGIAALSQRGAGRRRLAFVGWLVGAGRIWACGAGPLGLGH